MRKTFKYRILPNKVQLRKLEQSLDSCRWLYNHLLAERKSAWESERKNLSRYDQQKTFTGLKESHEFLKCVHSQVLQNVAVRLDLAFRFFFRRIKSGDSPGYPRFQGKHRYDSFTYPQSGFKLLNNTVQLFKIGNVKAKIHRPIEGEIKTCTVKRSSTNKWYVTFSCVLDHQPTPRPVNPAIGIDMGLESFATFSDTEKIKNPRFLRKEERALKKAQRKLSAQRKRSAARARARKVVARIHERIKWKRDNFAHQESRKIINQYNTVVVEDLSINDMKKDNCRGMNKSIGDAAWRSFLSMLSNKAEWAGKKCIQVNPAYTSQTCSNCGNRQKLKLNHRQYDCPCCGLSLDRDHNAALNILALGLQSFAQA